MGVVKLSEYRPGTNRVVCQNPVSESEGLWLCVGAGRADHGQGQLSTRLSPLRARVRGHCQGTETDPGAETPETQAGAGLLSRPRMGLRRPARPASVLSVR